MRKFFWSTSAKIMRLPRPASLQGPSSTLDPFWPVFPGPVPSMGGRFPALLSSVVALSSSVSALAGVPCPFRHRGSMAALSACGVRVLSAPAPLAVCWCVFPCSFWQSVPSLPDPAGSRLYAPLCCVRSAPIHRRAVLPVLVPAVVLTVSRCRPALLPRFSLYAPALIRSAVMVFRSSPPCRLESGRTAAPSSGHPSQCPGMRSLCCRCSSMSLAISWQCKSR